MILNQGLSCSTGYFCNYSTSAWKDCGVAQLSWNNWSYDSTIYIQISVSKRMWFKIALILIVYLLQEKPPPMLSSVFYSKWLEDDRTIANLTEHRQSQDNFISDGFAGAAMDQPQPPRFSLRWNIMEQTREDLPSIKGARRRSSWARVHREPPISRTVTTAL